MKSNEGELLDSAKVEELLPELTLIRSEMLAQSSSCQERLRRIHPNFRKSALNLLHYLTLRSRDLRPLQTQLAAMGLSSLGRAESHVLATLDAVVAALHRFSGQEWIAKEEEPGKVQFSEGERLLAEHTLELLGPAPPGRGTRIMVTMPEEAADNFQMVRNLLQEGMDCMRINCAHGQPSAWLRMIEQLQEARALSGRGCRVFMDLPGPKMRTGPVESGPEVMRIRPERDVFGRVLAPARIWMTREDSPQASPAPAALVLPMPAKWLEPLCPGDDLRFKDGRGAVRLWRVVAVGDYGCWAEAFQTAYVVPGTLLCHVKRTAGEPGSGAQARITKLPSREGVILLNQGDLLIVTRNLEPGRGALFDRAGALLTPASIGCTIPEVFDAVQPGESIWFDDGKIGGIVEQVEPERFIVRITHARFKGEKLRADKGINLPETKLHLPALSQKDLEDLGSIASYADAIQLSFANEASDVEAFQRHLEGLGNHHPALVLKIETRRGFENLPEMLLAAMRGPCCGVMIARGDLAVECGFERMAEVQEEILWICEAAHVPVIWATQVLENLAKQGLPSRAEITDAAMGHRAECVMLNKGPHILSAVRALSDILRRMEAHQTKKSAMLRELHLAHRQAAQAITSS